MWKTQEKRKDNNIALNDSQVAQDDGLFKRNSDTLLSSLGPTCSPRENNIHFKVNLVKGSAPKAA